MMRIPVYVRTKKESVRECVAIVEAIHGTGFRVSSTLAPSPMSMSMKGDTVPDNRRYAAVHMTQDGNRYAEEVVKPSEFVDACNHWREAYRRQVVNDYSMYAPRGFVVVCS